jgi:ankyrin repeat protein
MVNPYFESAVEDNDVSTVRELLRDGESPDDYELFLAIRRNSNAVLRVLIKAGANLNAVEHPKGGGNTPLMRAICSENMQAFRLLLKAGALINKRGSFEFPLHVAAREGSVAFTRACITAGAKIDARDGSRNTPLMIAALFGHADIVRLLHRAGANLRARDRVGQTACEIAAGDGETKVAALLTRLSVPEKKR